MDIIKDIIKEEIGLVYAPKLEIRLKQSLAKRMKELISDDTYILHNEEERELMNCIRNDVLRELALSEDLKE